MLSRIAPAPNFRTRVHGMLRLVRSAKPVDRSHAELRFVAMLSARPSRASGKICVMIEGALTGRSELAVSVDPKTVYKTLHCVCYSVLAGCVAHAGCLRDAEVQPGT